MKRPFKKLPNPPIYSYTLTSLKKDKYIRFNGEVKYPLYILKMILKDCEKKKVGERSTAVGLLIQVPNPFSKKSKKISLAHSKTLVKGKSKRGLTKNRNGRTKNKNN